MIDTAYKEMIQKAGLKPDPGQIHLAELFDKYKELFNEQASILGRVCAFFQNDGKKSFLRNGLYIWGGVGRGKSMMLDLFFNHLTNIKKRRIHFHQFMSDFHRSLGHWHANHSIGLERAGITSIAKEISYHHRVILLDELQVNNIADAMVLSRLFTKLFRYGCYIFITSNFHPDDLFQDGLQRERFLPFITLIKNKLNMYELNNFQDYRLIPDSAVFEKKYYWPIDDEAKYYLRMVLSSLLSEHAFVERTIKVDQNKELLVLKSYGSIAMFSFIELCKIPLGVLDYMSICDHFSTLIISDIPQMSSDDHNEALRFITLIDCLYEKKTKLFCTAQVDVDNLYIGNKHKKEFMRTTSRLHQICR